MARLSVNVNKVATLRNTRTLGIPSVVRAAELCIAAGAHGITIHPRPDERHIRRGDVFDIAELLAAHPHVEYNIEGNPFHGLIPLAREVRPTQVTLVPDAIDAFTSNHGWDIGRDAARLRPIVEELRGYGCRVSLFIDAVPSTIELVVGTGAERIELYTEPYAADHAAGSRERAAAPFAAAAQRASECGLGVNAGHDLNLENLPYFIAKVPGVLEVSIGHALIADALELGLAETVRRYLAAAREVA